MYDCQELYWGLRKTDLNRNTKFENRVYTGSTNKSGGVGYSDYYVQKAGDNS